jgi:hypothetical protein
MLPVGAGIECHRLQELLSALHHHLHPHTLSLRYRSDSPDLALGASPSRRRRCQTPADCAGLPKEASNQVSGIIKFVRNVGGSISSPLLGRLSRTALFSTRPICRSTCGPAIRPSSAVSTR